MTATEADARTPGAEISLRQPQGQPAAIPAKIAYARALAESGLLPGAYRKQPANILWAVEYGDMLGLSTMAAITGVHVIDGKPTASAGLISALVRRAGHKLEVWGDNKSATCKITRRDYPRPFEVTWTLKDDGVNPSAEKAKLLSKDVWQKYPASMLKSRAITQCARDACEEALFGLHYTPEELGADVDEDGAVVDDAPRLAERSSGTPDDDQWYVRDEPAGGAAWVEQATADAAAARSVNAAWKIRNEAGEKAKAGEITWDEARRIKELAEARAQDIRQDTFDKAMHLLSKDEPWRDKIDELACGDDADAALAELEPMPDRKRQQRISHAIVAKAELHQWNLDGHAVEPVEAA